MTIIALRNGIMAADSQSCFGNLIANNAQKLVKNSEGVKGGASGETASCYLFREWVRNGAVLNDIPDFDSLQGLVYYPKGDKTFIIQDGKNRYYELIDEFFAIGTGADLAMGAMAAGASAKEAAEIAIKYCTSCNGSVFVL